MRIEGLRVVGADLLPSTIAGHRRLRALSSQAVNQKPTELKSLSMFVHQVMTPVPVEPIESSTTAMIKASITAYSVAVAAESSLNHLRRELIKRMGDHHCARVTLLCPEAAMSGAFQPTTAVLCQRAEIHALQSARPVPGLTSLMEE
jgi:hypothetical protein